MARCCQENLLQTLARGLSNEEPGGAFGGGIYLSQERSCEVGLTHIIHCNTAAPSETPKRLNFKRSPSKTQRIVNNPTKNH
eukprot:1109728-Amphidinium_carterae.1